MYKKISTLILTLAIVLTTIPLVSQKAIAAGSANVTVSDRYNSCAWDKAFGQLGDKTTTNRYTPVKVMDSAKTSATTTKSSVLVNGKPVAFNAYTINNNNYFKLRDIAIALNGTEKQFGVGYDIDTKAITLTSGQPYTPTGEEFAARKGEEKVSAIQSASNVYLNSKKVELVAYTIEGNNYFKLRDLGAALNFGVDWDGKTNTISIDTNKDYEKPALAGVTTQMTPEITKRLRSYPFQEKPETDFIGMEGKSQIAEFLYRAFFEGGTVILENNERLYTNSELVYCITSGDFAIRCVYQEVHENGSVEENDVEFYLEISGLQGEASIVRCTGYKDLSNITTKKTLYSLLDFSNTKHGNSDFDNKVNEIISEIINDDMNDFNKVTAIYNYVYDNTRLNSDKAYNNSYAYSVLLYGVGNDIAYERAFRKLLDKVGISYKTLDIGHFGGSGSDYGFTIVTIDGKKYWFDVYYSRFIGSRYRCFCVSDRQMQKSFDISNVPQTGCDYELPLENIDFICGNYLYSLSKDEDSYYDNKYIYNISKIGFNDDTSALQIIDLSLESYKIQHLFVSGDWLYYDDYAERIFYDDYTERVYNINRLNLKTYQIEKLYEYTDEEMVITGMTIIDNALYTGFRRLYFEHYYDEIPINDYTIYRYDLTKSKKEVIFEYYDTEQTKEYLALENIDKRIGAVLEFLKYSDR